MGPVLLPSMFSAKPSYKGIMRLVLESKNLDQRQHLELFSYGHLLLVLAIPCRNLSFEAFFR